MAGLGNKKIKKLYLHRYATMVDPSDPIDENGMEIPSKKFRYFVVLDQNNMAYVVPAKYDKEKKDFVKAYEPEDVVDAAMGDKEKQKMIDSYSQQIREEFHNEDLMSDEWCQQIYQDTLSTFTRHLNERLTKKNLPERNISDMPSEVKTPSYFPKADLATVVNNAIIPPRTQNQGGQPPQ